MLLGCIADDFTGATDLANNLVQGGMKVVQYMGLPSDRRSAQARPADAGPGHAADGAGAQADAPDADVDADAVVIALKSRTAQPSVAIEQSLAALRWLRARGAQQVYLKICSTFDSTDRGNIGNVAEALMAALGATFAPVCPAFPENGRTVFNGYLFVGEVPLAESSMRLHPLTPMTDSNLVRVLQAQCVSKVGLVDHRVVGTGAQAVVRRMEALQRAGCGLAIVDAIDDADLWVLGRAFAGLPLVVGGSGLAIGLPQNFGIGVGAGVRAGSQERSSAGSDARSDASAKVLANARSNAEALPPAHGGRAVVSGSCSAVSLRQVERFMADGGAALEVDALDVAAGADVVGRAGEWAASRLGLGPVLVYATADPVKLAAVQGQLGAEASGRLVEQALAQIAVRLVEMGVRQLIVAGGETSGACVQALGIDHVRIGPQIDPACPGAMAESPSTGTDGMHVALKSGNFGGVDFYARAFAMLA